MFLLFLLTRSMILRCSWVTHGSLFQCDFAVVLLICHCQAGHAIASLEWYFAISRSLFLMYFWAGQLSAHGAALRNYGASRSCVLLGVGLSIISPRRVYSRTCKLICRSSVHFVNGQRETAQPRRLYLEPEARIRASSHHRNCAVSVIALKEAYIDTVVQV